MVDLNSKSRLRLYLVRHAEVEEGAAGKLLGRTDCALSERGVQQSNELAEPLIDSRLSAIYSSDLQRARVTAEIIAKPGGLKVRQDAAWREIDMGQWEERTMRSLHAESPELVAQLFTDPASFAYPGGESFATFLARIQIALDVLLQTHENGQVALVTHGGVCRAIIAGVLELPPRNWLRLAQDYCHVSVIDWYDGQPMLQLFNSRTAI